MGQIALNCESFEETKNHYGMDDGFAFESVDDRTALFGYDVFWDDGEKATFTDKGEIIFPVGSRESSGAKWNRKTISRKGIPALFDRILKIYAVDGHGDGRASKEVLSLASEFGGLHIYSDLGVDVDKVIKNTDLVRGALNDRSIFRKRKDTFKDWYDLSRDLNIVWKENERILQKVGKLEDSEENINLTISRNAKKTFYSITRIRKDMIKGIPVYEELRRPRDLFSLIWQVVLDTVNNKILSFFAPLRRCAVCGEFSFEEEDGVRLMRRTKDGFFAHILRVDDEGNEKDCYHILKERQARAAGKRDYKCVYCGKRDSLKNMKKMENKTNMYYHEKCMKDLEAKNKGQTLSD